MKSCTEMVQSAGHLAPRESLLGLVMRSSARESRQHLLVPVRRLIGCACPNPCVTVRRLIGCACPNPCGNLTWFNADSSSAKTRRPRFSADGNGITFHSTRGDLVDSDGNGQFSDIFLVHSHDRLFAHDFDPAH
ncbi:MAG: hypothetical protein JNN30_21610 [Rhodanobacteraceae bacterium]|nr:hypothetical protein [Rhodanobacteraceae bacterium]